MPKFLSDKYQIKDRRNQYHTKRVKKNKEISVAGATNTDQYHRTPNRKRLIFYEQYLTLAFTSIPPDLDPLTQNNY